MKILKIIFCLFILSAIFSCANNPLEQNQTMISGSKENWQYFDLDKEIEVKVLNHLPSPALCGNLAFASVTIVENSDGEQIRILDLCNTNNYKENEILSVKPVKKPEFNVILPYRYYVNPKTKKNEPFEIDIRVLRTAYGDLVNK